MKIGSVPTRINENLFAVMIDAKEAFKQYKEKTLNEARGKYSEDMLAAMEEELNSPCTEEMATFEKFAQFIENKDYDVIVFDTAPTGHTLRLLDQYINHRHEDGEFVSITGPSGSGKSTMLLALGGMSAPTAGKVLWENDSVYDWQLAQRAEWRAKMVGFVFQTFNLIPYLTVFENLSLALNLSGNREIEEEYIGKLLDQMKLSNRADHLPSELSIGQQQRVALARALVKNPKMILADEPTGNLDPQTASEILQMLKDINDQGKTVILITHDPNIAKMTNRNIKIVEGEASL